MPDAEPAKLKGFAMSHRRWMDQFRSASRRPREPLLTSDASTTRLDVEPERLRLAPSLQASRRHLELASTWMVDRW
jgi:hypothetical protein